jgi:hypothetical protein
MSQEFRNVKIFNKYYKKNTAITIKGKNFKFINKKKFNNQRNNLIKSSYYNMANKIAKQGKIRNNRGYCTAALRRNKANFAQQKNFRKYENVYLKNKKKNFYRKNKYLNKGGDKRMNKPFKRYFRMLVAVNL